MAFHALETRHEHFDFCFFIKWQEVCRTRERLVWFQVKLKMSDRRPLSKTVFQPYLYDDEVKKGLADGSLIEVGCLNPWRIVHVYIHRRRLQRYRLSPEPAVYL